MSSSLIQLQKISKSFGGNSVLKDVSVSFEPGKFYALLGRNGAGKSTLMKIIMRYEQPDHGDAWIFDTPLSGDYGEINRQIGYVSESLEYALPLKIKQIFAYYKEIYPSWNQELFANFLSHLRIDTNKYFRDLSRGQKMQVSFAAAAAIRPRLIILDEITAVLDANARRVVMNYLGGFVEEGGTVIMATNIVSEVQHYADHLILIDDGVIRFDHPLADIAKTFKKVRKKLGIENEIFKDPSCVEVGINSDSSISHLISSEAARRYDITDDIVDHRGITAEEIFIYYTRKERL